MDTVEPLSDIERPIAPQVMVMFSSELVQDLNVWRGPVEMRITRNPHSGRYEMEVRSFGG